MLFNLSTFIIYIDEHSNKTNVSSFYLNHQYDSYFEPIVRLILKNKSIFHKIKDKEAFKVVQIMLFKNIHKFTNDDILTFLDILGDPSFLSVSLNKHIQDLKFSTSQLENFEHSSRLKAFEYYNKALLRYF